MTGCDRCDRQGPGLDTTIDAMIALHRQWHSLGRVIADASDLWPFMVRVDGWLRRVLR